MDEKAKALKELLEILVEHPDLAERITITIKPNRIIQSNETKTFSTNTKYTQLDLNSKEEN